MVAKLKVLLIHIGIDAMKKIMAITTASLLFASVVSSASAASYYLNFEWPRNDIRGPADSLDYVYAIDQNLTVSGVKGMLGPNESAQVVEQSTFIGNEGLFVAGGTEGTSSFSSMYAWEFQMLVFDFGQAVTLDRLDVSYVYSDGGLSILGLTDLNASLNLDMTWSDLLDNGWEHAGNPNTYKYPIEWSSLTIQGGLLSRYWLIGAFNPAFGGYDDHMESAFNLAGISFSVTDVSEVPLPAAAWLFMTGLAGIGWMRKRKFNRELPLTTA